MRQPFQPRTCRVGYSPPAKEVEELVERAARHPLGTEFLRGGALDAVAAIFQVHAFTVEQARQHLDVRVSHRP